MLIIDCLVACILVLGIGLILRPHTQPALRWWWQRQSMHSHTHAEMIRDNILQESFVLRRQLELMQDLQPGTCQISDSNHELLVLEVANRLHGKLQALSDRLSPPFLQESLSLSLRTLVDSWQSSYPNAQISVTLPKEDLTATSEQQDVLIKIVDEFLRLMLAESEQPLEPIALTISLTLKSDVCLLDFLITYPPPFASTIQSHYQSLDYLGQIFEVLMPGTFSIKPGPQTLYWHGHWKSMAPQNP